MLLSYLTSEEKHRLVGSFVIENFWDTFIQQNIESIDAFRGIAKESIEVFIKSYQDVWDYVVGINLLDDVFLTESITANKVFRGLSLTEIQVASKLLSLSLYSELEKDCLMALNKTILTELAHDLRNKYSFNDEEFQLLMTPSFETFFTKYHLDHFEYAVNTSQSLKDEQRKQLIINYHAHDPELFELRFAGMHFPVGNNVGDLFSSQKNSMATKSAKKLAFIGDREDVKAFEKLLEYDNFLDFKYRYNLQACPEYYVRKMLFAECQSRGIFTNVEKPLALQDSEFILGVKALISLVEQKYIITLPDNVDSFDSYPQNMPTIPIEGSMLTILSHLKEGSPCLIKSTGKKALKKPFSDNMLVVGYEGDILLAKMRTIDKELIKVTAQDLQLFDEFIVLQKYSKKFIGDVYKSINKFIARTPYLNREIYENAF